MPVCMRKMIKNENVFKKYSLYGDTDTDIDTGRHTHAHAQTHMT